MAQNRQRKLFTNIPSARWGDDGTREWYHYSSKKRTPPNKTRTVGTAGNCLALLKMAVQDLSIYKVQRVAGRESPETGELYYGQSAEMDAAVWSGLNSGVVLSLIAVLWTVIWQNLQHLPLQQFFARHFNRRARRLAAMVDPFLSVTIEEYEGGRLKSSDAFQEVKSYLSTASTRDVRHLMAECAKDADKLVLSMAKGEEVADVFQDATVWWTAHSVPPARDSMPWSRAARAERRSFRLEFHERHRDLVVNTYLTHVRKQGRAVMVQNRQRKLFTNINRKGWNYDDGLYDEVWTHVPFEHPKTFDTLAMDPAKKKEIMDDLDMFKSGKEYHKRVGKAWKRGYLLYGPPGTGKSTMIAAMANYLDYDVYDCELTSVKSNTELRKLLIETKSKSIMVFEDIDCSLDLTGKRKKKKKVEDEKKDGDMPPKKEDDTSSKVTLSGLLNFIDGLWSACSEERLIVLTTNHVEKLDPALIRTGRMDKRIEMSYCDFESFKFLAKTHLGDVDVKSRELFNTVKELLQEVKMVPADVGEHLTPKREGAADAAYSCLINLVKALEKAKEEAAKGGKGEEDEEDAKEE